ncbi:MAG: carboxylesterase family protein [Chryseolinea sp.]
MKKASLSVLCLVVIAPFVHAQKATTPIVTGEGIALVQTQQGKAGGYIHNGTFTYKGIPYAKAKRFQAPEKADAWEGVRSSMSYGPVCPLLTPTTQVADESEFLFQHDWGYPNEDCLRVNVWTQGINDGKKRPVMVWLHGGGYTAGSSQELPSTDGESISKKGDIVLVSVNHRLNMLGFLDLSEFGDKYKGSSNSGMLDLVAALEWVKANIANFGGDPGNVTIFGQSGGGGKVTTLMSSPMAKGLYHKAIVESGVWSDYQDQSITKRVGSAVITELGLIPSTADSILKVPYEKLAAAGARALKKVRDQLVAEGKPVSGFRFGWSPTIDGSFLPYNCSDAKALSLSADVPLLIGSTKNEFMNSLRTPGLRNAIVEDAKAFLQKSYGDKTDAFITAAKKAYPADTKPSDLVDIDGFFRPGMVAQGNAKSASGKAPVYMYLLTWQSPVMNGYYKAVHCMDLPFVFNNIARCEEMTGGGKDAYILADKMSQSWINFARTGNPNHKGLPTWPAYTEQGGATMLFDNQNMVKNHHDKDVLAFLAAGPRLF